jgi:hypothetical protein
VTPGTALTNEIRAATSKLGARLFPMTVGKFWGPFHRGRRITKTETVTLKPGDVVIRAGHMVSVGFTGLSDTLGGSPMTITAEDVGKTVMILTAIEVKAGADSLRPGQPEFIAAVIKNGGRAGVARTPEDAVRICSGEDQKGISESSNS